MGGAVERLRGDRRITGPSGIHGDPAEDSCLAELPSHGASRRGLRRTLRFLRWRPTGSPEGPKENVGLRRSAAKRAPGANGTAGPGGGSDNGPVRRLPRTAEADQAHVVFLGRPRSHIAADIVDKTAT